MVGGRTFDVTEYYKGQYGLIERQTPINESDLTLSRTIVNTTSDLVVTIDESATSQTAIEPVFMVSSEKEAIEVLMEIAKTMAVAPTPALPAPGEAAMPTPQPTQPVKAEISVEALKQHLIDLQNQAQQSGDATTLHRTLKLIAASINNDPDILKQRGAMSEAQLEDTLNRLDEFSLGNTQSLIDAANRGADYNPVRAQLAQLQQAPVEARPAPIKRGKVYSDTHSLDQDISGLQSTLQQIGLGKLPRIGIHGEQAGHQPTGEFHYFVLDPALEDYWQPEWRDNHIDTMFKLRQGKLSLNDVFMGSVEFFERLQGTIIFTSDYARPDLSNGVLPEIYLLVNVPSRNFQLTDSEAGKEGAKVFVYNPETGNVDYRFLHVEGSKDTNAIPGEAIVAKIGLTQEEFAAITQWANANRSGVMGAKFFVCKLLYKKALEEIIAIATGKATSAVSTAAAPVSGMAPAQAPIHAVQKNVEDLWATENGLHEFMQRISSAENEREVVDHSSTLNAIYAGNQVSTGAVIRAMVYFTQFRNGMIANINDLNDLRQAVSRLVAQVNKLVVPGSYIYGEKDWLLRMCKILQMVDSNFDEYKALLISRIQQQPIQVAIISDWRDDNVTCGTICQAGHEGAYTALDNQLARQFDNFRATLGIEEKRDLTEQESDQALVKLGYAPDLKTLQQIRAEIRGKAGIPTTINIFFAIPDNNTELLWVDNDFGAGHFNQAGTRMHISLPFVMNRGIEAGIGVAGHELGHIQGRGHTAIEENVVQAISAARVHDLAKNVLATPESISETLQLQPISQGLGDIIQALHVEGKEAGFSCVLNGSNGIEGESFIIAERKTNFELRMAGSRDANGYKILTIHSHPFIIYNYFMPDGSTKVVAEGYILPGGEEFDAMCRSYPTGAVGLVWGNEAVGFYLTMITVNNGRDYSALSSIHEDDYVGLVQDLVRKNAVRFYKLTPDQPLSISFEKGKINPAIQEISANEAVSIRQQVFTNPQLTINDDERIFKGYREKALQESHSLEPAVIIAAIEKVEAGLREIDQQIDSGELTLKDILERIATMWEGNCLIAQRQGLLQALEIAKAREQKKEAKVVIAETIEIRQATTVEALGVSEGRDHDVKVVVGVPVDMNRADVQPTLSAINRGLAKNSFGRIEDNKQVITFEIDVKDPVKTAQNQERAMQKATEGLPSNGRVVLFAPQMEKGPQLAGKTQEQYKGQGNITVVPDAYTDSDPDKNMFPDIMVRVALGRNIAFYYTGNDPTGTLAIINSLLAKVAEGQPPIATINDLLNLLRPLRIRPFTYKEITDWQRSQKATATSL